jgi:hypothetical protein
MLACIGTWLLGSPGRGPSAATSHVAGLAYHASRSVIHSSKVRPPTDGGGGSGFGGGGGFGGASRYVPGATFSICSALTARKIACSQVFLLSPVPWMISPTVCGPSQSVK